MHGPDIRTPTIMASLHVAVADSVFPNLDPAREVLSRIGADLQLASDKTPEAILRVAADADALLVTYAQITADMIRQLTRCRIISRFGIGVDNVDLAEATKAGIVVTKVPDYCIDEVSDHAMALLLAAARKIPFSNGQVHAGTWKMPAVVPIRRLRGTVRRIPAFGRSPKTPRTRRAQRSAKKEGEKRKRKECHPERSRGICMVQHPRYRFLDSLRSLGMTVV